jgi:hypothetical protein
VIAKGSSIQGLMVVRYAKDRSVATFLRASR